MDTNASSLPGGVASAEALADEEDAFASMNSVIISGSLLALVAIGYRINTHRLRHLPESGAAIALGFVVGLVVRALHLKEEEQALNFRGEFFFHVLLPPIIFEAGLSLDTRLFVDNLGAIVTFAVVGTLTSTLVVSAGLRAAAKAGLVGFAVTPQLGIQCQLFGALISATDPVATIALFGGARFRADPLLHALINGESVLNDAVAIVLFGTLSHHINKEETPSLISAQILGHFFLVSLGSTLVGLAAGALCSGCFCQLQYLRRFPDLEISAMCLGAYLTFALSQLVGLSGIVSLFFFGIVLAHYNFYNLSEPSKVASKITFGTLSKLAEHCVFLYLGAVAALSVSRFHWHLPLVVFTVFVILLGRAAHVFPISMMLNLGRQRKKIDRNMTVMLWISGLRGAIAFALALRIPCASGRFGPRGSDECRNSDLFVTTTISVVMLTTLVVGTAMERVATSLRVIEPVASGAGGHSATAAEFRGHHRAAMTQRSECSLALSVPLASQGRHAEAGPAGPSWPHGAAPPTSASGSSTPPAGYVAAASGEEPLDVVAGDCFGHASSSRHPPPAGAPAPPEHGGGPEVRPGGGGVASAGGGSSTSWRQWHLRFNARGPLYQAFARFDLDVLQPRLGGPCRPRAPIGVGAGSSAEMALLWSRDGEPPPTDDEAPLYSRSFVFE